MPRTGKGGRRIGSVGVAYANRSDLSGAPAPEPISTVPGQGYGDAAAQQSAQRAIPLQGTPTAPVTPPAGAGGAPTLSQGTPAPSGPLPGSLLFDHPTMRPNEPVTAGLPTGPGPGTEAITGIGSAGMAHQNVASLLSTLARVPGATPDVAALAQYAQTKG